jgi:DNA-nicking Smr family endonuclease
VKRKHSASPFAILRSARFKVALAPAKPLPPPAPPPPSDEELFRAAMRDVIPLQHDRVYFAPPLPRPQPRQRELDEEAALYESLYDLSPLDLCLEGGDEPAFLRPGLPRALLRDLRRGRWVVQAQLDLHGATREQARELLAMFLAGCLKRGVRYVRVIHGKGLGSPGREPVLKGLVLGWLAQRGEVLAFCQARASEGGAGALMVLLQAPSKR